jgi:hypothetical protein
MRMHHYHYGALANLHLDRPCHRPTVSLSLYITQAELADHCIKEFVIAEGECDCPEED